MNFVRLLFILSSLTHLILKLVFFLLYLANYLFWLPKPEISVQTLFFDKVHNCKPIINIAFQNYKFNF